MSNPPDAAGRKHILIVDDNLELAQTYQELFELHDYRATIATNGDQAQQLLLNLDVDAILCDLSMPQLEGDMLYAKVQSSRPELCARFIFVTGNEGNPKYEPFLKKTGSPVLYKPVSMDSLLEALKGVVGPSP